MAWALTYWIVRRLDSGALDGVPHGAIAALAFGRHSGDVEGVGAHAVADDLGEDFCASGLSKFQVFEDEDARAFADDEAVAVFVKGAAGVFGVVVAGGKRAHGGESADSHGSDGGLGAPGDHGVGVAPLDGPVGVADGVGAGGAGGRRGLVGPFGAVTDAHVAGGQVHDGRGNEEGRDLARATIEQVAMFALNDVEAADAGADVDSDALFIFGGHLQARRIPSPRTWPRARNE